jgi:hypothetical protein
MTTNKVRKCGATTSKGKPCKNSALDGSDYCGLHDNWETKTDDEKTEATIGPSSPPTEVRQEVIEAPAAEAALHANPEFAKFEVAKRIAHTLANSNLVPDAYRGRPNDCFVAINMGAELGMEPFQAIQSIAVIDGKPAIFGDGLIGLVRGSGKCEYIKEWLSEDGNTAYCETQRKGEKHPVTGEYSMSDAMLAGIDAKKNWKKHPKRMLKMRARAYCLRDAYADVLKGLAAADEMYDHEDTPAPVHDYELPAPPPQQALPPGGKETEVTLSEVERAMHQSDTMEDLLKAADKAKRLSPMDQGTARITFSKMRKAILEL